MSFFNKKLNIAISLVFLGVCNSANSQCTPITDQHAILRQPGLYQLIGNIDSAFDTPNGIQGQSSALVRVPTNHLHKHQINSFVKTRRFEETQTLAEVEKWCVY